MSQNDMSLANQARSSFRTDLNAALQALASTSKGPSAPSTAYQGQFWLDDNTPSATVWTLSLYDGVDWIPVGTFDTTTNTFTLSNEPAGVPTGTIMAYGGATEPSGWLFAYGQAISRTTYADLFAILSTTYGGGDGSTTFNVPDLRGRFPAGRDNMGGTTIGRITSALGGIVGTTLGAVGGSQAISSVVAHVHSAWRIIATTANANYSGGLDSPVNMLTDASFDSGGSTGSTGASTVTVLPPTIVVNYIIKT
jgi:microcystin-dependent protein